MMYLWLSLLQWARGGGEVYQWVYLWLSWLQWVYDVYMVVIVTVG